MSNRQSSAALEDISSPQPYASSSAVNNNVGGDYSGNTGSNNTYGSGNTNHYYGGTNSPPTYAEIMQCLYTSVYESHRDRVRKPVAGTCTWVTEHPKFTEWVGKKESSLLWLSADPGCGKSVIASFLVDHLRTRPDTMVCYFFFKDDYESQRSAKFALCAILHQLFMKKNSLYTHAAEQFRAKGKGFMEEVGALWDIMVKVVADWGRGEVFCVVDALDECEESTRVHLLRHMARLQESKTPSIPLKFLVTSRPYHEIENELGSPVDTIRLKGEDEVKALTSAVTCVIDEGIRTLESRWGQPGKLGYLRDLLESSADRTFLWVSLVLELLKESRDNSREEFLNIATTAPRDLPALYTKILDKSGDRERARRILHIVVAAARPLTLGEINVAFRIKREHTTVNDIGDLSTASEAIVKNACGLFVRIIDSKVYLVHQTAREFLIKQSLAGEGEWQYTLCSVDSNWILADVCISYLSLRDFGDDPLAMDPLWTGGSARGEAIRNYAQKYALLDYAARNWADHFRDSEHRQMELFESTRQICQRGSNKFLTWLGVYWETSGQYYPFPNDFTHLMIASWLGQETVVKRLLKEGDINARSAGYGTALNVAALVRGWDVAETLMRRGVKAYLRGKEYNILLTWRVGIQLCGGRRMMANIGLAHGE